MKRAFRSALATLLLIPLAAFGDSDDFARTRERFSAPPASAGTVTLYWLNGEITKDGIREQMKALFLVAPPKA